MNAAQYRRCLFLACFGIILAQISGCKPDQGKSAVYSGDRKSSVVGETALLDVIESSHVEAADAQGNVPNVTVYFNDRGRGVAYAIRNGGTFRFVHRGKASGPLQAIDSVTLSPDGNRAAYSALVDGKWRMFIDGEEGLQSDEVSAAAFSPDSRHVAYAVRSGGAWYLVRDDRRMSPGRVHISGPFFSADSRKIVYAEQRENQGAFRLMIRDLDGNELSVQESCGRDFTISADGTRIVSICEIGEKRRVVLFRFDKPFLLKEGALFDDLSNMVFGDDGESVAYLGVREGKRFLVVNGGEEPLPDEGAIPWPPVIRPGSNGAGILISGSRGFYLYQSSLQRTAAEDASADVYDEAADLAYNSDGSSYAFSARTGTNWFVVVNGQKGPKFDRVVTPQFSPDGSKLVYRARKHGKRFVVVADSRRTIIRQFPSYDQVFPVVFTSDGKFVCYGVKDGRKLMWLAEKL